MCSPEQCLNYIDDVIVFSAYFEQHLTRLCSVLERIVRAGLGKNCKGWSWKGLQGLVLERIARAGLGKDCKDWSWKGLQGLVLERIARAGLRLKTAKCQFVQHQVKYLGQVVSVQEIERDSENPCCKELYHSN